MNNFTPYCFGASGTTSFPKNLKLDKDEFENFGGPGEGGVSRFEPAAPVGVVEVRVHTRRCSAGAGVRAPV